MKWAILGLSLLLISGLVNVLQAAERVVVCEEAYSEG